MTLELRFFSTLLDPARLVTLEWRLAHDSWFACNRWKQAKKGYPAVCTKKFSQRSGR